MSQEPLYPNFDGKFGLRDTQNSPHVLRVETRHDASFHVILLAPNKPFTVNPGDRDRSQITI